LFQADRHHKPAGSRVFQLQKNFHFHTEKMAYMGKVHLLRPRGK